MRFTWKIWLQPNLLTKKVANDSFAEVSTAGDTKHNIDVAKAIKEEGSELSEKTILDILDRGDLTRRKFVLGGSSVQDGNVRLAPRVTGSWEGADPKYDPAAHKKTIDATPTAELRKAIDEEVGVELLGKKTDGGAIIGLVTDAYTGKTDGTISVYGDLIIEGEKIKIAPLGEAGLGVFYVAADGTEKKDLTPLTQNDPKKIICHVPQLAPGTYMLKVVTRFSNSALLLNAPRTLMYETPLTVADASSSEVR